VWIKGRLSTVIHIQYTAFFGKKFFCAVKHSEIGLFDTAEPGGKLKLTELITESGKKCYFVSNQSQIFPKH
jgi:hypothetical protein